MIQCQGEETQTDSAYVDSSSGLGRLWLGTWALSGNFVNAGRSMGRGDISETSARDLISYALSRGVRYFDTSDAYGLGRACQIIGHATKREARDSFRIALKLGYVERDGASGLAPSALQKSLEIALEALKTEYVDIFSFHHEFFGESDEYLEPALDLVSKWKDEGIVKQIGRRVLHKFTSLASDISVRQDNRQRDRYDYIASDVVHAKANILCSDTHLDGLKPYRGHPALMLNKPMGQGLVWWISKNAIRQLDQADHRVQICGFGADAQDRQIRMFKEVLPLFGKQLSELPEIALGFLRNEFPNAQIVFGASSETQLSEFLERWHSSGAVLNNAIDLNEFRERISPWLKYRH